MEVHLGLLFRAPFYGCKNGLRRHLYGLRLQKLVYLYGFRSWCTSAAESDPLLQGHFEIRPQAHQTGRWPGCRHEGLRRRRLHHGGVHVLLCLRARYKLPWRHRCAPSLAGQWPTTGRARAHWLPWRENWARRRCSPPTQCAAASRSSAWSRRPARPSQPWARSSTTRGQPSREEHAGCFQALLACKCCCVQRTF